MRDWHIEHMERTLVKYIRGVSEDATGWEKRLNKRYGTFWRVSKRLEYDIRHGVEREQVYSYLQSIRTEPSFTEVRSNEGSMKRLDQIQEYFQ
jgi:hypothetical protein